MGDDAVAHRVSDYVDSGDAGHAAQLDQELLKVGHRPLRVRFIRRIRAGLALRWPAKENRGPFECEIVAQLPSSSHRVSKGAVVSVNEYKRCATGSMRLRCQEFFELA